MYRDSGRPEIMPARLVPKSLFELRLFTTIFMRRLDELSDQPEMYDQISDTQLESIIMNLGRLSAMADIAFFNPQDYYQEEGDTNGKKAVRSIDARFDDRLNVVAEFEQQENGLVSKVHRPVRLRAILPEQKRVLITFSNSQFCVAALVHFSSARFMPSVFVTAPLVQGEQRAEWLIWKEALNFFPPNGRSPAS